MNCLSSSATAEPIRSPLLPAALSKPIEEPSITAGPDAPQLLLGAVDVVSGALKAFDSRRGEVSADAVLASAAIPTFSGPCP